MKAKSRSLATDVAGIVLGAAVGSKIAGLNVSFIPDKVKPLIPVVGGIFLARAKSPFMKAAGAGMIAAGGVKTIAAFAPGLGISALEDSVGDYQIEGIPSYILNGPNSSDQTPSYILAGMDINTDKLG